MRFPEDDEMDLEEADAALRNIDKEMGYMAEERNRIQRSMKKRQLEPVTAKLVELAQSAGEGLGTNRALRERVRFLEKRIEVRDEELERLSDRDAWKARAEAAEATIERSKKRKASRRK